MVRRVILFSDTKAEDAVGTKAKNIALLLQAGFPVPNGFIITAEAFKLANRGEWDPDPFVFPEPLRREIEEAFRQYVAPPAVVRSSCSAEDLESASFAGQYESILNVTSSDLLEAIKRCSLSVYKDRAQTYMTQRLNAADEEPAMSVIVQELIDAEAAGVIFSRNPITGNEDEIIINSNFGLGETVVTGLATPDFFILSKRGNTVLRKELGEKVCKAVLDRMGTRIIETTLQEQSSYSLQDEQLHELRGMTVAIETLLGHPVDLEFAYRQGKLYILQARRITA
jgi:pyruvate,water dikinase